MTQQDILAIVLKHLHDLVPGASERPVEIDAPISDLGADSLDLVDMASRSMQEIGVTIPRSEIGRIHSLRDLVAVLHRVHEAEQVNPAAQAEAAGPA